MQFTKRDSRGRLPLTHDKHGKGKNGNISRLFFAAVAVMGLSIFVLNELYYHSNDDVSRGKGKMYYVEVSDSSENVLPGSSFAKNKINKSKKYDVCAIGAGLSGTVFAERYANELKKNALVIDSRSHVGGNCYDFIDQKTGILRNQYGSHLFHTNIERVWNYVNSFEKAPKWKRWYHAKFGLVNGDYVPIPVNTQTVNRLLDLDIQTEDEMKAWLKTVQIPCPETGCENAEQMAKSRVGEKLYHMIFEGYTIKQWGISPAELDASVTARIPVFSTFDPRYFADKWQALPEKGYTKWFETLLDHPLIDVVLNTDFFDNRKHLESACEKIIFTGPIDQYFSDEGYEKLEYRSIKFREERHYNHPGYLLPGGPVLNYPGLDIEYTRAVEYKSYLHRPSNHSIVVKETTSKDGEPYYPVPTPRNQNLYKKYQKLAADLEKKGKIQFVGRLANYKYFNMDQAIDNALSLFERSIDTRVRYDFMENQFEEYKAVIDTKMEEQYPDNDIDKDCTIPMADIEFGMELRVFVPWANYIREQCGKLWTAGLPGTKYMYFFSNHHKIKAGQRAYSELPDGNPFGQRTVHMSSIPAGAQWKPPSFKDFFHEPKFFEPLLGGKPLVVILNKYTQEWKKEPVNFIDTETLRKILTRLTPDYTVLYKRNTPSSLRDEKHIAGSDFGHKLGEKEMIRKEFPDVLMFEDFSDALKDPNDFNLLQFGFMSMSKNFIVVQGGTAVMGSYFGGNTFIYAKEGFELEEGDFNYFPDFSNAKVSVSSDYTSFYEDIEKHFGSGVGSLSAVSA